MATQPSSEQRAQDLCLAVIKMARRVQTLPKGATHLIAVVKHEDGTWDLILLAEGKIEHLS